jgi:3'-phosphoadenosine 5'-phosphosulfate sulfotransferase (PAPS reductase)/FAD synthetase
MNIENEIWIIKESEEYAKSCDKTLKIAYSGGIDSEIILDLAKKSGIEFKVETFDTGIFHKESFDYILKRNNELKKYGISCKIIGELSTTSNKSYHHDLPPQICCEINITSKALGHYLTGIRLSQSKEIYSEMKDQIFLNHSFSSTLRRYICRDVVLTNPILNWDDKMVMEYVSQESLTVNPSYETHGYAGCNKRICPMYLKINSEE